MLMDLFSIIGLLTAASFLVYGVSCLVSLKMKDEFKRFGLSDVQRKMTGALQLLGAIGLMVGVWLSPFIGLISTVGLSLLMLLGFAVRLKIRDPFLQAFPSFLFMVINAYLGYQFYLILNIISA